LRLRRARFGLGAEILSHNTKRCATRSLRSACPRTGLSSKSKDVRVGDMALVEKAGEIIPQVIEVVLAERPADTLPWQPPRSCPACGSEVRRVEGEAAPGCPNGACPGRLKAALFYFTRRSGMDIDGLGHSLIEQLVDTGLVRDLGDLFALRARRTELIALPRMTDRSANKLLKSIDDARGSHIRPKIGSSVASYLGDPYNRRVLEKLIALGVSAQAAEVGTRWPAAWTFFLCHRYIVRATRGHSRKNSGARGRDPQLRQEGHARIDRRREGRKGEDRKGAKKWRLDPRPTGAGCAPGWGQSPESRELGVGCVRTLYLFELHELSESRNTTLKAAAAQERIPKDGAHSGAVRQ
jgi:NAD-dependent DNA ligase OB-fold domain